MGGVCVCENSDESKWLSIAEFDCIDCLQFLVLTVLPFDEAGKKKLGRERPAVRSCLDKVSKRLSWRFHFGKPNTSVSLFPVLGGREVYILCQKWYDY